MGRRMVTDTSVTEYIPLGFIRHTLYHVTDKTGSGWSGESRGVYAYEVFDGEKFVPWDSPEGVEVVNKIMMRLDRLWEYSK